MRTRRLLVVEDEAIVADDLQDRLRALGYDPAGVVAEGENALSKAEELGAEVVLMDIQLKGAVDGVQAADEIREKLDIPVVFLTAHVDEATFQRAKITAPFGYVRKPFDERELHAALEIALYRHASESQLKKTQLWLQAVLECLDVPLVVTDKWGLVELMIPQPEGLADGVQPRRSCGRWQRCSRWSMPPPASPCSCRWAIASRSSQRSSRLPRYCSGWLRARRHWWITRGLRFSTAAGA